MLPARLRSDRRPHTIVGVGKSVARIRQQADGNIAEVSLHELPDALGRLVRLEKRAGRPLVELVLEPGCYLERQLSPFRLAKRRARNMAALDIQLSTPLEPAGVVPLFARGDRDRPGHRYFIVKRKVLVPLVAAVESAPARLAAVKVRNGDETIELDPDDYRFLTRRTRRDATAGTLLKAGIVACIVGATATFAHAQWRYTSGLSQLDQTIETLNVEVKAVRALAEQRKQQIERIESVRAQKEQAIPLVRIWEEMTRVIPDNSWISDLSVNGGKVTFTGISKSAAGLIALLDASPLFAGPTFTAPVAKAIGTEGERFTIEMELER
ncbi:PilN domain-containing protein [Mesorhizobium sp. ZC-5]|uniref:PilN domain-containing protein n=1 Tax=Mesorhizobium sp. ZC-5 TaxID=2986066 RepID=UPI0021E96E5C|nr:PilN domain-containing protein [Mesorhizobium sp. ZC-5]MCV3243104.1 PilN domain-containing protein [Mesorhizobium sp. ZC-5]